MKKYFPLLAVALLSCLFIYVFYRTDRTLVNQLILKLFSPEAYAGLKTGVRSVLPLHHNLVYSLPEGLWVFCITITSSFFYLELQQRQWRLVFVPMLLALVMELFQLWQVTNGRFDWMDLAFAAGFWLLGLYWTRANTVKQPLFRSVNRKTVFCMISYSIVYLAHVTH